MEYYTKYPQLQYHQNASNSFCFNSLEYLFIASGANNSAGAIQMQIKELLHCHYKVYKDRTVFCNYIMK